MQVLCCAVLCCPVRASSVSRMGWYVLVRAWATGGCRDTRGGDQAGWGQAGKQASRQTQCENDGCFSFARGGGASRATR